MLGYQIFGTEWHICDQCGRDYDYCGHYPWTDDHDDDYDDDNNENDDYVCDHDNSLCNCYSNDTSSQSHTEHLCDNSELNDLGHACDNGELNDFGHTHDDTNCSTT